MIAVVIEDSRTQAYRLRSLLEREGYEVRLALSGEEGLRACSLPGPPPDVVVSDVLMPGIDGYEVCRRLKADPATRDLPIMLLTSLADPLDVVRALEAGADNFVTKPYSDDRLLARLRRLHEARQGAAGEAAVEIQGERFSITAPRAQVLALLVSCLEDAAERNAELELNRKKLALANEQREALMGIVAHELKTPISALLLSAQMAARSQGREGALSRLPELVERQVDKLLRIIEDLQDITQIELGTLRIERKPADLAEVVREVVERLRPSAASRVIDVHGPERLPCQLDTARIEQVVSNLVTNALKYSSPASRVELRIEALGAEVRVSVTDQGIGIAPEAVPHVFDRYFRSKGGQQKAQGLGLGLFICKQLIELHGGEIGLTSVLGQGSTFWFSIPCDALAPSGETSS
jgi:signal transduction histidine kinase